MKGMACRKTLRAHPGSPPHARAGQTGAAARRPRWCQSRRACPARRRPAGRSPACRSRGATCSPATPAARGCPARSRHRQTAPPACPAPPPGLSASSSASCAQGTADPGGAQPWFWRACARPGHPAAPPCPERAQSKVGTHPLTTATSSPQASAGHAGGRAGAPRAWRRTRLEQIIMMLRQPQPQPMSFAPVW